MDTHTLPPPSTNGHAPSNTHFDDVLPPSSSLKSHVSGLKSSPNSSSEADTPQPIFPHSNGGRIKEGGGHGGPKTAAGKAQSRLNALKHTLTACDEIFLTGLEPERYQAYINLRMMLRRHYRPATEMERLLVDRIAINQYRLLTLYRVEAKAVANTPDNLMAKCSVVPHLDRFSHYDVRLERQNRKLHNRLVQLFEKRGVTCHKPFSPHD